MSSVEAEPTSDQRERWRTDSQREWSDAAKVAAWRKWGRLNIAAQREATAALLDIAVIAPGMHVVDIGGGGGDPALAAASMVGPTGLVTVADVSAGMIDTARQFAREDGLDNLTFHVADAEHLPFPDASFDRALARCVVMFFPDPVAALREILRVLKPGGRAAFLAWGPLEQHPLFGGMFFSIGKVLSLPQPPPDAPGPFRFASPGRLSEALRQAGYHDIDERAITPLSHWEITPDRFVDLMVEMGGLHWLLDQMTDVQRGQVLQDATEHYRSYWDGTSISLPLACVLATGVRASERNT